MSKFSKKVSAFLKMDDDKKAEKFGVQAVKEWKNQITIREREIEELKEKAEELKSDDAEEIVYDLDMDQLRNVDTRKAYVDEYTSKLVSLYTREKSLEDDIKTLEDEIAKFNWMISKVAE